MKCGICKQPLEDFVSICNCGEDPYAGWVLNERYKLLGELGKGGMSLIYRALRIEDEKLCAIKISRWSEALQRVRQWEEEKAKEEEISRIDREWKLLQKAASRSPHVVQVLDEYLEDPRLGFYYPMEYLDGQPLSQLPDWGSSMPPKRVMELLLQLGEGVGVAHGLGVVHRDLNPDNLFIVRQDDQEFFVKLIDFGVARDLYARREIYNTNTDIAFGHFHYLSPEQIGYDPVDDEYKRELAAKVDHRADIYSIGALMFHMLTGMPLFDETGLQELAERNWIKPKNLVFALQEQMIPFDLQDILLSCLHPLPEKRLPDILAFNDMLQNYLNQISPEEDFGEFLEKTVPVDDPSLYEVNPDEELTGSWMPPYFETFQPSAAPQERSLSSEIAIFSDTFNQFHEGSSDMSGEMSDEFALSESIEEIEEVIIPSQEPSPKKSTPPPPPPKAPPEPPEGASISISNIDEKSQRRSSLPSEVWKSLDNAPSFFDDEKADVPSQSPPAGASPLVMDHNDMDVANFFDGIEDIVEETSLPTSKKNDATYNVLPARSPQLEKIISSAVKDPNHGLPVDLSTSPSPKEPLPFDEGNLSQPYLSSVRHDGPKPFRTYSKDSLYDISAHSMRKDPRGHVSPWKVILLVILVLALGFFLGRVF